MHSIFPTKLGKFVYFIAMPGSNMLAAWLSWTVVQTWADSAPLPHRAIYGVLTVLLLAIRTVGVVLEAMKACAHEAKEVGTEKKKKKKHD